MGFYLKSSAFWCNVYFNLKKLKENNLCVQCHILLQLIFIYRTCTSCLVLFLISINTAVLELDLQLLCRLVTEMPARFYLVICVVMHVSTHF